MSDFFLFVLCFWVLFLRVAESFDAAFWFVVLAVEAICIVQQ